MSGWRRLLLTLLGVGLALTWVGPDRPVQAQAPLTIENLIIEVWPEYDRPLVLVLLTGTLPAGTSLPAQVQVRLPAAAQLNATAFQNAAGQLMSAQSTTQPDGDALVVTLTVEALNFHVEYYDPGLTKSGGARAYTFNWTSAYALQAVEVRVQQPIDASNLVLDPAFTPAGTRDFGLEYFTRAWGVVPAGQPIAFMLDYTKSTDRLSVEVVSAPTQSLAIDNSTPTVATPFGALSPWVIGGVVLGVLFIAGGAGWLLWQRSNAREVSHKTKRGSRGQRPGTRPAPGPNVAATAPRFCTQCGQTVAADDRFCRSCGSPLSDRA